MKGTASSKGDRVFSLLSSLLLPGLPREMRSLSLGVRDPFVALLPLPLSTKIVIGKYLTSVAAAVYHMDWDGVKD